ncbi:MAG: glycosyltransferase family 4 protein [Flavobacteriales bacterium]
MKKILFIASHRPGRAPGQRFRFEQYLPYLEKNGYQCHLSYLLTEEDDRLLYTKGKFIGKAAMLLSHWEKRWQDLRHAKHYDIIFIFREALMTRSIFFEKQLAKSRAKIIFDFDDAIWHNDTSHANRLFRWMKNPAKINRTIALSDMVFAGNQYLADYAKQFNHKVVIIPTTIDTDEYPMSNDKDEISRRDRSNDAVTIGWSGSLTTIKHFELAIPFLKEIKNMYGNRVLFKVIGDTNYHNASLGIQGIAWSKADEVKELSEIDIGIMPLPDDEWARGKCGLKGLQYMALGIPTLMSPVGVNGHIIQHGVNGYLPQSNEMWVQIISTLIESTELRTTIGSAARKTVVEHYSVHRWQEEYLSQMNHLVNH